MSSKKLLEQCSKLEKLWPHVFTTTLELESGEGWYNQLVDLIEKQQTAPIWMSETKVRSGVILSISWLAKFDIIIRALPQRQNYSHEFDHRS